MLQTLTEEFFTGSTLPLPVVLARTLGALFFAGLIGFEREYDGRPAGLRTHMLISLAACLYALIMLALIGRADEMGEHVQVDPVRIVEAVTQGVAFLAAGLIVFAQGTVRGLTTGTSMWLCAAVGLACGIGEWMVAGLATVLALVVITVLRLGERVAGTYQPGHTDHHANDTATGGGDGG